MVRHEGKRRVQRRLKHYNLDVIISVGYRVNSQRGVQFRQWATRLLKEHLTRGYTLNRQRFEDNARELEAALALVRKAAGGDSEQNRAKRSALDAWVKGVNAKGGFGVWCWDVAFQPAQIQDIIEKHAKQVTDSRLRV